MLFEFVPTLAAFDDVIKFVVPILFMVLYGIGQLMAGKEKAEQAKKVRQPRPAQPPADGNPPNQADSLRREVEQFLRHAKGQADPPREKLAPPVRTIAQRPAKRPTKQRANLSQAGPKKTQAPPPRSMSQSRSMSQNKVQREGVAEHVAKHIDSDDISEHADRLGYSISQTDEKTEARLQAKFGQRSNTFQHKSSSTDQQEQTLGAQELFDLLSHPEGMRQAILMHEILRRPTDRW